MVTVVHRRAGMGSEKYSKLFHNGIGVDAVHCVIQNPNGLETEDVRLIVIARGTVNRRWILDEKNCLINARRGEELIAIVANLETDKGLSYRSSLVSIFEREWSSFSDRMWEIVLLA